MRIVARIERSASVCLHIECILNCININTESFAAHEIQYNNDNHVTVRSLRCLTWIHTRNSFDFAYFPDSSLPVSLSLSMHSISNRLNKNQCCAGLWVKFIECCIILYVIEPKKFRPLNDVIRSIQHTIRLICMQSMVLRLTAHGSWNLAYSQKYHWDCSRVSRLQQHELW